MFLQELVINDFIDGYLDVFLSVIKSSVFNTSSSSSVSLL